MDMEVYCCITDKYMRKCWTISNELEDIGTRENYSVTSILDCVYFKTLSEDHKAQVFKDHEYLCNSGHSIKKRSCVYKLAEHDNPTYIQQMLPYMPLHKFQSCSLPSDFTWIESEEWMRDMLMKHKVRWNADLAEGKNESRGKDSDTIQKLSNLAFTMLAAELFYICCESEATRTCRYLLKIAPKLVYVKAGCDEAVALCNAFTCNNSDVVALLLEAHAPLGNIAQAVYLIFKNCSNSESFSFIVNALNGLQNRDEVRLYKDPKGNTILHLLCSQWTRINWLIDVYENSEASQYLPLCIQTMLCYGVDASVINDCNETALDVLIGQYVKSPGIYRSELTDIFLRDLEFILPSWGLVLPSCFPRDNETTQDRVVILCTIAELLSHKLTLKVVICTLQVARSLFYLCQPPDCKPCLPTISLVYRAMCRGIDMYSFPGKPLPASGGELYCQDYVSYLLNAITKYPLHRYISCCDWALLELLVHTRNDAFSHMHALDRDAVMRSPISLVCDLLKKLVNCWVGMRNEICLDQIRNIMSLLNMYSPSLLEGAISELHALCSHYEQVVLGPQTIHHDYHDKELVLLGLQTISQIPDEIVRVRSLKLLCRLTILDNMKWKDVEKLPLPRVLKGYMRIGNIAASHVIHQLI